MKFAVALLALSFVAQSFVPSFAQSAPSEELAAMPVLDSPAVNAFGGEGATRVKVQFTDEQKEKLYEMKNKLLTESGPKKLALKEQQRQLKDLLTKETIDRKAIQDTQSKINSLRTDLANVHLAFRMDMQEQLTPEQRKAMRYRGMKSGGKSKMKHHRRGHKGFPRATEETENKIGAEPMNFEQYAPANI